MILLIVINQEILQMVEQMIQILMKNVILKKNSHQGYYSEMGVYKANGEYISFVGKKDKVSGVNVGSGFMDVEPVAYYDYLHDYACKKLWALTKLEMDKNTDLEVLLCKYPYGMSLRRAKRTGGKPIKIV